MPVSTYQYLWVALPDGARFLWEQRCRARFQFLIFHFPFSINQVARFYLNLALHLLQIITFFHYLHFSSITITRSIYQRTVRLETALPPCWFVRHCHIVSRTMESIVWTERWTTLWAGLIESYCIYLEQQSDAFIAYGYRTVRRLLAVSGVGQIESA